MLTNDFKRVLNNGENAPGGPLPLEQAFDNSAMLPTAAELDLFLKGLSVEIQEEVDLSLANGMRLALLDAFDIQRARDHGIPDYNTLREAYGLPRITTFAEITNNVLVQNTIAAVCGSVDRIDAFVGALAEDHLGGASVGPLTAAAYLLQFESLRSGDRFWFEFDSDFTAEEIAELQQTRLADIIIRNTGVRNLPANVFFVTPEPGSLVMLIFTLVTKVTSRGRCVNQH